MKPATITETGSHQVLRVTLSDYVSDKKEQQILSDIAEGISVEGMMERR